MSVLRGVAKKCLYLLLTRSCLVGSFSLLKVESQAKLKYGIKNIQNLKPSTPEVPLNNLSDLTDVKLYYCTLAPGIREKNDTFSYLNGNMRKLGNNFCYHKLKCNIDS